MNDVAKFVRHAMNQVPAGEHPDENQLSAFSESTLPQRERQELLAHLSQCAQCRDVVALSMPDGSAPVPASPLIQRHKLRWPLLRWAGVMAALVIVATAVLVQRSRLMEPPLPQVTTSRETSQMSATVAQPSANSKDRVTSGIRGAGETRVAPRTTEFDTGVALQKDEARAASVEQKKGKEVASGHQNASPSKLPDTPLGSPNPTQAESKTAVGQSAQARDQFETSQIRAQGRNAVEKVQGEPGPQKYALAQEPAAVGGVSRAPQAPVPDQAQASTVNVLKMDQQQQSAAIPPKASAAAQNVAISPENGRQAQQTTRQIVPSSPLVAETVTVQSDSRTDNLSPRAKSSTVVAGQSPLRMAANVGSVRWRLTPEGAVERSTDAGRSWRGVALAKNPPVLRSISVVGSDVWVGGAGGALYHSANNGASWAAVTIKSEDMILADDIVKVEYTDPQRGSVTAASGAVWMTTDGGATWSIRH